MGVKVLGGDYITTESGTGLVWSYGARFGSSCRHGKSHAWNARCTLPRGMERTTTSWGRNTTSRPRMFFHCGGRLNDPQESAEGQGHAVTPREEVELARRKL